MNRVHVDHFLKNTSSIQILCSKQMRFLFLTKLYVYRCRRLRRPWRVATRYSVSRPNTAGQVWSGRASQYSSLGSHSPRFAAIWFWNRRTWAPHPTWSWRSGWVQHSPWFLWCPRLWPTWRSCHRYWLASWIHRSCAPWCSRWCSSAARTPWPRHSPYSNTSHISADLGADSHWWNARFFPPTFWMCPTPFRLPLAYDNSIRLILWSLLGSSVGFLPDLSAGTSGQHFLDSK